MPLQQRVDHRCGRVDFAHRHRMQPDIDRAAGSAVAAVALVPALEVFRIAETAPDKVVDGDRRQYVKHRRIQGAQQAFGWSLFDGGSTFATKIAAAQAEFNDQYKAGAYIAAGLVLFVLTFVVNALARATISGTTKR